MKRRTLQQHAIPKSVNFANNPDDLECAIMGEAGWHTRAIARETGLTESQVTYRLARASVKRANYRNGESEMAHFMLAQIRNRGNRRKMLESTRQLPVEIDRLQEQYITALAKHQARHMHRSSYSS